VYVVGEPTAEYVCILLAEVDDEIAVVAEPSPQSTTILGVRAPKSTIGNVNVTRRWY
jgi:hypothetical protein